jgi:ParB/RepB/Spo0J family partition protein
METPETLLADRRAILLEHILPSPTTSQEHRRKSFDKGQLQELADSIKTHGLVNPILVRPVPSTGKKNGHYELVAGERRFLAAQLAGLERIECTVRHLGDGDVVELQLIENLQRADLHPMHEAESYDELIHKFDHTADEVAAKVGKSRAYVYGRMKLLALSKGCRKAFYDGQISASIAEKIARIPTHPLQDQALEVVLGYPNAREKWQRRQPMSFREAVEHINDNFMLDLSGASFPLTDAELVPAAGPCTTCPKRTGNQPELFDDVKKGNTCTDTACFALKTRAYGARQIEAAQKEGKPVLVGKAAARIAPSGAGHYLTGGYAKLDDTKWTGGGAKPVSKLLKKDAKIELLWDPKSGAAIEVVHESQIKKSKTATLQENNNEKWRKDQRQKAARAKLETAVRHAVFKAIAAKGKWKPAPMRELAELVCEGMDYDAGEALLDLLEVPVGKPGLHDRLHEYVKTLKTDAQLSTFIAQAYLGAELHVSSYDVQKSFPRLEAAAKVARVDVKKIRKELAKGVRK